VLALSHLLMLPSVLSSTSASRSKSFSRLNGWPVRSPVNASPTSSQMPPHNSGASVVRYTFTARDFHSLLFAGFAGALINPHRLAAYALAATLLLGSGGAVFAQTSSGGNTAGGVVTSSDQSRTTEGSGSSMNRAGVDDSHFDWELYS
jgi:hypothetical protein